MSPEESEDDVGDNDSGSSESNQDGEPSAKRSKIIRVCPLSWRSERFNSLLSSLDWKHARKISERSRAMTKKRGKGPILNQQAPDSVPTWMMKSTSE
jgi:hypothetical protein